jgi:hypothetical protein
METNGPHVHTLPVRYAPSQAPCPTCGKLARRKATHHRWVRSLAYKQVVFLDVTYGEYRACCGCCVTFRTTPPGIEPRARWAIVNCCGRQNFRRRAVASHRR